MPDLLPILISAFGKLAQRASPDSLHEDLADLHQLTGAAVPEHHKNLLRQRELAAITKEELAEEQAEVDALLAKIRAKRAKAREKEGGQS